MSIELTRRGFLELTGFFSGGVVISPDLIPDWALRLHETAEYREFLNSINPNASFTLGASDEIYRTNGVGIYHLDIDENMWTHVGESLNNYKPRRIVSAPEQTPIVAASNETNHGGYLFKLNTETCAWEPYLEEESLLAEINSIYYLQDGTTVVAGQRQYDDSPILWKTPENDSWDARSANQLPDNVRSLVLDPNHPQQMYAIATGSVLQRNQGLYRSTNDGWTWEIRQPIPKSYLEPGTLLTTHPTDNNIVHAGINAWDGDRINPIIMSSLDRLSTLDENLPTNQETTRGLPTGGFLTAITTSQEHIFASILHNNKQAAGIYSRTHDGSNTKFEKISDLPRDLGLVQIATDAEDGSEKIFALDVDEGFYILSNGTWEDTGSLPAPPHSPIKASLPGPFPPVK